MSSVRAHLAHLLKAKTLTLTGVAAEMGASHHTVRTVATPGKSCNTHSIERATKALERLGHWPPHDRQVESGGKNLPSQAGPMILDRGQAIKPAVGEKLPPTTTEEDAA